jgi:hypothetical protein
VTCASSRITLASSISSSSKASGYAERGSPCGPLREDLLGYLVETIDTGVAAKCFSPVMGVDLPIWVLYP